MTTTETINLISELSTNLKSATDNDDDMKEADRVYLNGLCAELKLASDTIRNVMERENDYTGRFFDTQSK